MFGSSCIIQRRTLLRIQLPHETGTSPDSTSSVLDLHTDSTICAVAKPPWILFFQTKFILNMNYSRLNMNLVPSVRIKEEPVNVYIPEKTGAPNNMDGKNVKAKLDHVQFTEFKVEVDL